MILVGSSEKMNTFDNPLSYNERRKLIKKCFPGKDVFPVSDKESDEEWVESIEEKFKFEVVVSGNEWTRECFERKNHRVKKPPFYRRDIYRGTLIRKKAKKGDESWKELVPEQVLELLEEFRFQKRMEKIEEV